MSQFNISKKDISIIVAVDENNIIGKDNKLLWHIPDDLKRFKILTADNYVIMGRKTYESIGKPLPNRENIVVSRKDISINGVIVANSVDQAIDMCKNDKRIFIIGGAEIYSQTVGIANYIYLTRIHKCFYGNKFFPEINSSEYRKVFQTEFQILDNEKIIYSFIIYSR